MRDTRAHSVRMSADAAVTAANVFPPKVAIAGFARGLKHKAWGNLKVLVVCIPRGVLNDVHELE